MKKLLLLFASMFVINGHSSPLYGEAIEWKQNFEEALLLSKEKSKPLALFFTGSDWCSVCGKMEKEVFSNKEFIKATAGKFIFVKLDYPMRIKQSEEMVKQNRILQQRYDVKSFPTLLILTPDLKEIGMTGYRSGGGKSYSEHLIALTEEYVGYDKKMRLLGKGTLTGTELKKLYHQAQSFNLEGDKVAIVSEGIRSDRPHFFMIERYRQLGAKGATEEGEAAAIKGALIANDPTNRYLTHYQIACIDFNALAGKMQKGLCSADEAVRPLTAYLGQFGESDSQNLWRINMIISQVYQDTDECDKALAYAESAHKAAPENFRRDIAQAIDAIKVGLINK